MEKKPEREVYVMDDSAFAEEIAMAIKEEENSCEEIKIVPRVDGAEDLFPKMKKVSKKAAIKIAKQYEKDVNYCVEYSNAYFFSNYDDDSEGVSPVVVMKDGGDVMNIFAYIDRYGGEYVSEGKI